MVWSMRKKPANSLKKLFSTGSFDSRGGSRCCSRLGGGLSPRCCLYGGCLLSGCIAAEPAASLLR